MEELLLGDVINNISEVVKHDKYDYYYHAFHDVSDKALNSYFNDGIKSPILLHTYGGGNNGFFYVSLSRPNKLGKSFTFDYFVRNSPLFLVNSNIKTYKTKQSHTTYLNMLSPLPFRHSNYNDEYQKFLKVNSKDIVGLEFKIAELIDSDKRDNLEYLKCILSYMEKENIQLPLYDYSYADTRIVDKGKCLELLRKM